MVNLSRGTRGADLARCAHVAEPHEATWTHMDADVARRLFGLAGDGLLSPGK